MNLSLNFRLRTVSILFCAALFLTASASAQELVASGAAPDGIARLGRLDTSQDVAVLRGPSTPE